MNEEFPSQQPTTLHRHLRIADLGVETLGPDPKAILSNISLEFTSNCFGAIIGPSGCGKTTLIKAIAGVVQGRESGAIFWNDRNLEADDFAVGEFGYVPQFSTFHEQLTPKEILTFSRRLRVVGQSRSRTSTFVDQLMTEVGLWSVADQPASTLSGGQRRRLSLAVELCSDPSILLCDEVTSGLDPHTENDILAMLRRQATDYGRMVLIVTHGQTDLDVFDSVTVLTGGRVAFSGSTDSAREYFGTSQLTEVHRMLAIVPPWEWAERYDQLLEQGYNPAQDSPQVNERVEHPAKGKTPNRPGYLRQFHLLLSRRLKCFLRSPVEVFLHLFLIMSFPAIVSIFAWDGIPHIQSLGFGIERNLNFRFEEAVTFLEDSSELGSLVSGITMFQVILLCIMGANNSSREVARERRIYERERLAGLRASSYASSKFLFLILLCIPQSIWMGLFVHHVCDFPGDLFTKCVFLFLGNMALTFIGLAISSTAKSSEVASLVSLYVVGFQIPLSGAVLALPELIGPFVRPFVSSYWSWSGVVRTLEDESFYDIVSSVAQSPIAEMEISIGLLVLHIVLGALVAWVGCEHRKIEALQ